MCQAPPPAVSLNIIEATFTQPAIGEDESSGHSWSITHDSTYFFSHLVTLFSLLTSETALATILAQTLWHRKPGHIWEALLGKASLPGQSL